MPFTSLGLGVLMILLSSAFTGVHTSVLKMEAIQLARVKVTIVNIYMLLGTTIIYFAVYVILLIMGETVQFTYLGIIFALINIINEAFLLQATKEIGVSFSMAFSSFVGTIGSVLCQKILHQSIDTTWLMYIGLIITIVPAITMAFLPKILIYFGLHSSAVNAVENKNESEKSPLLENNLDLHEFENNVIIHTFANHTNDNGDIALLTKKQMAVGFLYSLISGVASTTVYLPTLYAIDDASDLKFFYSAGIGQLVTLPIAVLLVFCMSLEEDETAAQVLTDLISMKSSIWKFEQVFWLSFTFGLIVGVANVTAIAAFAVMDYIIAMSLSNFDIIVGFLCGIILWKEMTSFAAVGIFALCSIVFIAGAVIVTIGVSG